MRSLILAAAALLSSAAFAQRTNSANPIQDRAIDPGTVVTGTTVVVKGTNEGPNAFGVTWDGSKNEPVAIVMERDFRDCIPGNLDREDLERVHGEIR